MGRRPSDELGALADTARAHLKRAKALGKSLDVRLAAKSKTADDFSLDEDTRRDFATITLAIQHAGKSLQQALEAQKKQNGGMTDAQLDAQFAFELVRMAPQLTDTQWASMVEAREKARSTK